MVVLRKLAMPVAGGVPCVGSTFLCLFQEGNTIWQKTFSPMNSNFILSNTTKILLFSIMTMPLIAFILAFLNRLIAIHTCTTDRYNPQYKMIFFFFWMFLWYTYTRSYQTGKEILCYKNYMFFSGKKPFCQLQWSWRFFLCSGSDRIRLILLISISGLSGSSSVWWQL